MPSVHWACCCKTPGVCKNDCAAEDDMASAGCMIQGEPTPTALTVTIAGLQRLVECFECFKTVGGGIDTTHIDISGTAPNGTFVLNQVNANLWQATAMVTPLIVRTTYGCPGTSYGQHNVLFLAVAYSIGQWRIRMEIVDEDMGNIPPLLLLFEATIPTGPCCYPQTVNNSVTSSGCGVPGGFTYVAFGGTATIEPCDRNEGVNAYPDFEYPEE